MITEEKFKNYGIIDTDITAVVMISDKKQESAYSLPIITRLPVQLKKQANKKTVTIQLPDNSVIAVDACQLLKILNQC